MMKVLFTSFMGYVRMVMMMMVVMMMVMVMMFTSAMGYVRMEAAGSGSQIHSMAGCSNCC